MHHCRWGMSETSRYVKKKIGILGLLRPIPTILAGRSGMKSTSNPKNVLKSVILWSLGIYGSIFNGFGFLRFSFSEPTHSIAYYCRHYCAPSDTLTQFWYCFVGNLPIGWLFDLWQFCTQIIKHVAYFTWLDCKMWCFSFVPNYIY